MRSVDRTARAIVWIWRATKAWAFQALAVASSVCFVVWGTYGEEVWGKGFWAFLVGLILAVSAFVAQIALHQPSYMKLAEQKELAEEKSAAKSKAIERALAVLCRKIAEHCGLAANSDRVSVYYRHEDMFIMLARWSQHPERTKPGRGSYPIDQGAIGIAWDLGEIAQVLPANRTTWDKRLAKNYGFDEEVAASLKMHCQSIAAMRVVEADRAVGVIVFESTEQGRATIEVLEKARNSMLYAALTELVGAFASLTPQVESITTASNTSGRPTATAPWKNVEQITVP